MILENKIKELPNKDAPIVFLDIDGVLNSTAYYKRVRNPDDVDKKIRMERRQSDLESLDKEAISFLNEISDWNFVLTSTWRKTRELEYMNSLLTEKGFEGEIFSYTPNIRSDAALRGNEIYAWLKMNAPKHFQDNDNYVIFDDDNDMLLWQKDAFIYVDNYFGLSPNHVYNAKRKTGYS